jgi:hypothetical protein
LLQFRELQDQFYISRLRGERQEQAVTCRAADHGLVVEYSYFDHSHDTQAMHPAGLFGARQAQAPGVRGSNHSLADPTLRVRQQDDF